MRNDRFPDQPIRVPDDVTKRVAESPYDKLFSNGVTPNGYAYTFELPTNREARRLARNRHANNLANACKRYNHAQPNKSNHMTHRVVTKGNILYVFIAKKYNEISD